MFRNTVILSAAVVVATMGLSSRCMAADPGQTVPPGVIASLWALPAGDASVTLIESGKTDPVTVPVAATSMFSGICHDCGMVLKFTAAQAGKSCVMCPCAVPMSECIVWTKLKHNTWGDMLQGLPKGTALHVVFNDPDKPEAGVKTIVMDRRTVLLQADGLDKVDTTQLMAIAKPLGATKAEVSADKKQLTLMLQSDWTNDKAGKLQKALAAAGVTIDAAVPAAG